MAGPVTDMHVHTYIEYVHAYITDSLDVTEAEWFSESATIRHL